MEKVKQTDGMGWNGMRLYGMDRQTNVQRSKCPEYVSDGQKEKKKKVISLDK